MMNLFKGLDLKNVINHAGKAAVMDAATMVIATAGINIVLGIKDKIKDRKDMNITEKEA